MNTLFVITAVHNRYDITEKFVDSLKLQTFQKFQLILVDDGSTDGTDKMVKGKLPTSMILYGNGNLWWGGALHEAYGYVKRASLAPEDYVLIINDDNNLSEDFLETGVNLLRDNQRAIVTANGYSQNDGSLRCVVLDYDVKTGETFNLMPGDEGNCSSSRALFFRVKDFLHIGGFHPILLPHYGSDHEFTLRAWRKGYRIKSFAELNYTYDETATGDRTYSQYGTKELVKKLFSKRSSFNPVYKLIFILMVTPLRYLPRVMYNQSVKFITKCRTKD